MSALPERLMSPLSLTVTYEDTSPAVRALFTAEAELQSWLEVEAAVARCQAELGIIPASAAEEITRCARIERFEVSDFEERFTATVHPVVAMVRMLADACEGGAGEYVHWGVTTQDVIDTGLVLRLREAERLIRSATGALADVLAALAIEHRDTAMVGRTNGQHATPITFGYKLAVRVDEFRRHLHRLDQQRDELLTGQLGGATGTLAAMGPEGLEVRRRTMAELGLAEAAITWHVARDRQAMFAYTCGMIAVAVQNLAREVVHLQRSEIAEVEEPFPAGKVGSSTMPHKRNPAIAQMMGGIGDLVRADLAAVPTFLSPLHEREKGYYQLEATVLGSICARTHRLLELGHYLIEGLSVDVDRMRSNIDLTDGLVHSEALMMGLARRLGRQTAHELLNRLAMTSIEEGRSFRAAVQEDPQILDVIAPAELGQLLAGAGQTLAGVMVDRVCGPRT